MRRSSLAIFTVLAMLASAGRTTAAVTGQAQQQPTSSKKAAPAKKGQGSTLTGCVDQQEGRYILVDDHGLNRIADLEADGFPTEGFAKYVGQKVTVRGASATNSDHPLFKVRQVEVISETCAPQPPQQGKK